MLAGDKHLRVIDFHIPIFQTESTSPHTEEASQDLSQSGGENTGNGPEFNQVYNVIYPGYYFNGICNPNGRTKIFSEASNQNEVALQTKTEPKDIIRPRLQDERRYSPRHQTKMSNSAKRFINNYNSNPKHVDTASEIIKSCPRFEKYSNRNNITPQQNKVNPIKKLDEPVKETPRTPAPTKTTQWISVSSKKKRKNRSTPDDDTEQLIEESDEVITLVEPTLEEIQSSQIDNIIEDITNCEANPKKSNNIPNIDQIQLRDVKDVEEELFKTSPKLAEIEASILKQEEARKIVPEPKSESSQPQPTPKSTKQHENQKKKAKKTGRKTTPNTNAKSQLKPEPQINEHPEKISQKNLKTEAIEGVQKIKEVDLVSSSKEATTEKIAPTPLEESIDISATPDKKKSKKKKKLPKSNLSTSIPSISSSTATLNNIDDSYDFLLDTTSLIDDKTNIEVSEELDKMIQKGLFGNLEEKFRSLNVSVDDDFFKSLSLKSKTQSLFGNLEEKFRSLNVSVDDDFFKSLSLKSKTQSTTERGFIKATNFTTILNNNTNFTTILNNNNSSFPRYLKLRMQPSPPKSCNFLEKTTESDTGPPPEISQHVSNSKSNGKLKNKKTSSERDEIVTTSEESAPTDEIASKCEKTVSRSAEFISENDIDSKKFDESDSNPIIIEDAIQVDEELKTEDSTSEVPQLSKDNAIQVDEELKTEDSTSEVPQLSKDNDNNLNQKLSDELQLRPINGYILQTNNPRLNTDLANLRIEISLQSITTNGQAATEPRKIKKKRRRKISKTINQDETTSSEDGYSSDEAVTQVENRVQAPKKTISCNGVDESTPTVETITSISHKLDEECPTQNTESQTENIQEETPQATISLKETDVAQDNLRIIEEAQSENGIEEEQLKEVKLEGEEHQETVPEETTPTDETNKSELALDQNQENLDNNQTPTQESIDTTPEQTQTNTNERVENLVKESKFNLNAEEFVPRAYRPMEPIPVDPNLQFINIHPNFVPLPLINHPLNELNPPRSISILH
ncbi:hypothetical protein QE152_g23294 [Popillia japonica]|uniref:Uncharacterized protein n=1 Tax=Popillia japonica TaxID=7064 RepID=A0AAW1KHK1_POPJA